MAYRIDEERFSYNKDSDEWFCVQGNKTERKKYAKINVEENTIDITLKRKNAKIVLKGRVY